MLEIPRLAELTRHDFVHKYLRPQVPFILTGEASKWPAIGKWSLDYLAETHLDHRVLVEYYPTQQRNHVYTYVEMLVSEYVQRIKSDPTARHTYYIADTSVESTLPAIKDDIRPPSDEREAVLQHLEVFDGKLPGDVKQQSMNTVVERSNPIVSQD